MEDPVLAHNVGKVLQRPSKGFFAYRARRASGPKALADQRCEAVAKLGERPVMTATIKLPTEAVFPMGRCEYSFDPKVTVRLSLPLRL